MVRTGIIDTDAPRLRLNCWFSFSLSLVLVLDGESIVFPVRYTLEAMEVDQFIHDHPDFLVLVAAGNSGPDYNSVGSPATAKNILSVSLPRHLVSYSCMRACVSVHTMSRLRFSAYCVTPLRVYSFDTMLRLLNMAELSAGAIVAGFASCWCDLRLHASMPSAHADVLSAFATVQVGAGSNTLAGNQAYGYAASSWVLRELPGPPCHPAGTMIWLLSFVVFMGSLGALWCLGD